MKDKDFEMLAERRPLLTDTGYFDRWRNLAPNHSSVDAWLLVEREIHEAFGVRRFLTYPAFHQAMLRNTAAIQGGERRGVVRLYEVNNV